MAGFALGHTIPAADLKSAMTEGPKPTPTPPANPPEPGQKPARAGATTSDERGVLGRDSARALAAAFARSLIDDKCQDIIILDIADLTTVTSCLVIGTGTSDRQMQSALKNLKDVGAAFGSNHPRISADDNATWLLADYIDVVVHLFEPNARAYYDLESMWTDAPTIEPAARNPTAADRTDAAGS